MENVWQFMRGNWLSNRVFTTYDDIVAHLLRGMDQAHRSGMAHHLNRNA
jgi:hypothetical protein